ncbi:hydroxyisourate hydrolase [Granulicella sp. S190]|uniref:hydroxyisourate hydrolase n=1 Tax=Granulicella sp. S190 TaxID=1747226 RepID=UPI00131C5AEE|nr:hydroxyisourate hydrolase [Granulicella sp. S190]
MGISTHILDIAFGRPATGVPITLARMSDGAWSVINEATTDTDGRCKHLLPAAELLLPGIYRVHFATEAYYQQHQLHGLYPYVEIIFTVTEADQHYHIPLLLTANGYTTYRGS